MYRCICALFCLAITVLPVSVDAQNTDASLEQCVAIKDPVTRLSCFDRQMSSRQGNGVGQPSPPAATAAPTPKAAPVKQASPAAGPQAPSVADETVGLDGKQLRSRLKALGQTTTKPAAIVSQVKSVIPRPGKLNLFVLGNGQSWEQVESKWDLDIGVNDTVTITPGALGSFFLKTENKQSIRVHRVD